MAARTWEKGRRETSWFEAGLPRVAARSHSRLPGPWNTWGIQPSRCSVWDEPLVTLQQLNIFFTVVRTRMTPCALSLHPVSATHPVQGTPPPRTRRGGVRGGGNASIGTKVGIGGAATHPPTLERAEPQREPQDSRQMHHSRTSMSPALLTKLQKVASLRVQTVKERALFRPLGADRNWGP